MSHELFAQQIEEMRHRISESQRLLRTSPVPYREVLTDAFSQIDVTLEELNVAENEILVQSEALFQSAHELEAERHRYRSLFEFAPSGYIVTDSYGVIREANQAASTMLGLATRFLLRKPIVAFIAQNDRPRFNDNMSALKYAGQVPEWEVDVQPRRGGSFTASVMVSVERSANGAIAAIRWLLRDATERKKAEAKIHFLNSEFEQRVAERTRDLEQALRRERHVTEILVRRMVEPVLPEVCDGVVVESLYQAASDELLIGGDFIDSFALTDDAMAYILGDVSGKGLVAASYTAEIKYTLRAFLTNSHHAEDALRSLNRYLCGVRSRHPNEDDIFVVMMIAIICPGEDTLVIATAGAEPALLQRANGTVEAMHSGGLPLGVFADAEYVTNQCAFAAGDRLLLFTDGITEARHGGCQLGPEGVKELACRCRRQPIADAARFIMDGARLFTGDRLQDDACLLLAERTASRSRPRGAPLSN